MKDTNLIPPLKVFESKSVYLKRERKIKGKKGMWNIESTLTLGTKNKLKFCTSYVKYAGKTTNPYHWKVSSFSKLQAGKNVDGSVLCHWLYLAKLRLFRLEIGFWSHQDRRQRRSGHATCAPSLRSARWGPVWVLLSSRWELQWTTAAHIRVSYSTFGFNNVRKC